MLAHHWKEAYFKLLTTVLRLYRVVVTLDTNPRHLSTLSNDLLTNNRNIVFSGTSNYARGTPCARGKIDCHSPRIERMLSLLIHLLGLMMTLMSITVSVTVVAFAMSLSSRSTCDELGLSKIAPLLRVEILDCDKISTTESTHHLHWDARKRKGVYARSECLWKKRECASIPCACGISTIRRVSLP